MKEGSGMDYKKTAHEILSAIGGKDNLASAAHCAHDSGWLSPTTVR